MINLMSRLSTESNMFPFLKIDISRQYWPQNSIERGFDGQFFGGALLVCLSLVIGASNCIQHPVHEREKKIRNQLRISGMSFISYWYSLLLIDLIIYMIGAVALVFGIFYYNCRGFQTLNSKIALIAIIIGYGPCIVQSTYVLSFLYQKQQTASATGVMLVEIVSIVPFTIVSTLGMFGYKAVSEAISIILAVINPFYTGISGVYGIFALYKEYAVKGMANEIPERAYFDFSFPAIPLSLVLVYIQNYFLYYLLMFVEVKYSGGSSKDVVPCRKFRKNSLRKVSDSSTKLHIEISSDSVLDDDVIEESSLVVKQVEMLNKLEKDKIPVILVDKLWKKFGSENKTCLKSSSSEEKVVVEDVSFSVSPGQVLGLLGPNGAGKTTTISMVNAEQSADSGNVYVVGNHIKSCTSEAYKNMGYCPQDNPVWDMITLKEHLNLYAAARGIPVSKRNETVNAFIDALDIKEHANKLGKQLSGGTQRKLCFAMSMLNSPPVVLFDEPSSGQDPKTKRFMWNAITQAFKNSKRGAILTTHYMDEADALCNKIAIMVKGKLKCIGTTQHLKDKFGKGYVLEIKLKSAQQQSQVNDLVYELFGEIVSRETFGSRYVFNIPQANIKSLSQVFRTLEDGKKSLNIEQYSFSQSTLE